MSTLSKLDSNSPIAFFDSGVGGLTVLNKVKKLLPNEKFIYYGDTLHVPYGEKTKAELLDYSAKILKFFEEKQCKAVVMACNTTSSVIFDEINGKYNFKIYPIVQSVTQLLSELPIERLGVFATRATITSNVYPREIEKYNKKMKVFGQHCPEWVNIVEKNTLTNPDSVAIIKSDLDKMMLNNPQKIVLGCTHYPFLLNVLSHFVNKDLFIDPATHFAEYIKLDLEKNNLINDATTERFEDFYVSSNPEQFKNAAKMFYNLNEQPKFLAF